MSWVQNKQHNFSTNWKKFCVILAPYFSTFFHLDCYRQVESIFNSDYSVKILILKNFCSIIITNIRVRIVVSQLHKSILSVRSKIFRPGKRFAPNAQCPNFSTRWSQSDWNRLVAKKHSVPKPVVTLRSVQFFLLYLKIKTPNLAFLSRKEVLIQTRSSTKRMIWISKRSCVHVNFFSMDSEFERARHKVFNYAVQNHIETVVNGKLDSFFNKIQCAAKGNLAFGFIVKIIEYEKVRYFHTHEKITLLDRSKIVFTKEDKKYQIVNKTDVLESCSWKRMITKWKFYKLTNFTIFAELLKHVPMGWKDAVLPKPLLKNFTINCLTFEENTSKLYHWCPFRAFALHLHRTQRLEWKTSKNFNLFIKRADQLSPNHL